MSDPKKKPLYDSGQMDYDGDQGDQALDQEEDPLSPEQEVFLTLMDLQRVPPID